MPRPAPSRLVATLHRVEGAVLVAAFLVSMILPLIDAIARPLDERQRSEEHTSELQSL